MKNNLRIAFASMAFTGNLFGAIFTKGLGRWCFVFATFCFLAALLSSLFRKGGESTTA